MVFQMEQSRVSAAPGGAYERAPASFLEGVHLAYGEQVRTGNQYSIEVGFVEEEDRMLREMADAGHRGIRPLSDFIQESRLPSTLNPEQRQHMLDRVSFGRRRQLVGSALPFLFEDGEVDPETREAITRYNAQFASLKGTPFEGTDTRDMASALIGRVVEKAQKAVGAAAEVDTTTLGDIGFFAGGAIGSVGNQTNPWALATLPLGGAGRTVVGRIVSEGAVQAGVETGLQALGAQTTRRRLGLPHGAGQAALEIAAAGTFGAAFQGVGEAFMAGARRLVRDPAKAEIPTEARERPAQGPAVLTRQGETIPQVLDSPENPYGMSGLARQRATADMQAVLAQLDDTSGPVPLRLRPARAGLSGTTALTSAVDEVDLTFRASRGDAESVHQLVELEDPKLAAKWQKLQSRRDALSQQAQSEARNRPVEAARSAERLDAEAQRLEAQIEKQTGELARAQKKAQRQRIRRAMRENEAKLQDVQEQRLALSERGEPPPTKAEANARARLVEVDEQLRDLAPLYSRAVAARRGEFPDGQANDRFQSLVLGRDMPTPADAGQDLFSATTEAQRRVAASERVPQESAPLSAKEIETEIDEMAEIVDAELSAVRALIAAEADEITVDGLPIRLADEIDLPGLDGEGTRRITVRQLVDELRNEDEVIGAFTTCRLSATAS